MSQVFYIMSTDDGES